MPFASMTTGGVTAGTSYADCMADVRSTPRPAVPSIVRP
jgi:hypothetical protein